MSSLRRAAVLLFIGLGGVGCGTAAKKPAVDALMSDSATRRQTIEAVLQNLDKHPEYVDDVYRATRQHPVTLARVEEDAAQDLKDPEFAKATIAVLAKTPEAVGTTTASTIGMLPHEPEARVAVDHAIAANPDGAVGIVARDKGTMVALVHSSAKLATADDKARAALIAAIQKDAPDLVAILVKDPTTLDAIADPMFHAVDADPNARRALVEAVDRAAPKIVELLSEDPKMLARLTEAVIKASLHDKAALKQMLKRLVD